MDLKETLKDAVSGTGDIGQVVMSTTRKLVEEGTHDISKIFGAIISLGSEGVLDITKGVEGVFVGSVNALKNSGKTTEAAVGEVTIEAEKALGDVAEQGEKSVGSAAQKGIEQAKEVIKKPLE